MSALVVSQHKAVFFTYKITDETGEIVEQSDLPIGYVHGANSEIVKKLEQNMEGCSIGDHIEVQLTPEEGFGVVDPELTFTDDLKNVPPEFHHVGAEVEMQSDEGEVKKFQVSKIENGQLTVNGNHPLAGKHVTFNIIITEIRDAAMEEIHSGRPDDTLPAVLH
jgi:FKBP-type peptidyl-prolyl cis-trans isomerase SlyD